MNKSNFSDSYSLFEKLSNTMGIVGSDDGKLPVPSYSDNFVVIYFTGYLELKIIK